MRFSISTNWCARRHTAGEALIDEVLELGFEAVELGYHTSEELAEGIGRRVAEGAVVVDSVHSYCPVPIGAPHGYPELYLLASLDENERAMAAILLERTMEFAVQMGAGAVVLHAGRVFLESRWWGDLGTRRLARTLMQECGGEVESREYQGLLARARKRRGKRMQRYFDYFCMALDGLLPKFERAGVNLCLENLPSIEAFPDVDEVGLLQERFAGSALRHWHDMGHGQVREYLGWDNNLAVAERLLGVTRGIHIHDALPPMGDHLPPGRGGIDFAAFSFYGQEGIIRVFEPGSDISGEAVAESLRLLRRLWGRL